MARAVMAAAALVLLAVVAWGTARFAGDDDVPATSARGPEPMVMQQPPVRPPSVEPAPVSPPPATTPGDRPRDPGDVTRPAATMGRQEVPQAQARGIGESRSPSGPSGADRSPRAPLPAPRERPAARQPERRAPVPLKEPLPVVNSILVAPDRRLAVVDGAIVREGDAVGRRVLIRIEPGAVVLREPSGYEVRVLIRRRVGGAAGSEPGI